MTLVSSRALKRRSTFIIYINKTKPEASKTEKHTVVIISNLTDFFFILSPNLKRIHESWMYAPKLDQLSDSKKDSHI